MMALLLAVRWVPHVGAVSVQQHHPAAGAAVEREILAEEAHRQGADVKLHCTPPQ